MYSVTVKIEDIERRRRSAGILHVVIGFYLLAKATDYYRYLHFETFLPALPAFIMAGVSLGYGFLRRQFDPLAKYNNGLRLFQLITFIVMAVALMKVGTGIDYYSLFAFAAVTLLLFITEQKIFQESNIVFDENGVSIPGSFRSHLVPWEALSEVVVREDFITLFHIKEKYLQYQVLQDLSTLEIAKMNAFCKEKIDALGPRPTNDKL